MCGSPGVDAVDVARAGSEYKHVLVAQDQFTGKSWARALRSQDLPELLSVLEPLVADFATVATLVVDGGLCSKGLVAWADSWGISVQETSANMPQTNGRAERVVGMYKEALARMASKDRLDFHLQLPAISRAINGASRAQVSPDFLTFGLEQAPLTAHPRTLTLEADGEHKEWLQNLLDVRSRHIEALARAQAAQKREFDKRAIDLDFGEGDLVWCKDVSKDTVSVARKLRPPLTGPWEVLQLLPRKRAHIGLLSEPQTTSVVHVDLLTPLRAAAAERERREQVDPDVAEEVEHIVDHHELDGKVYYRVKVKGKELLPATLDRAWVPEEHLSAPLALARYKALLAKRSAPLTGVGQRTRRRLVPRA